MCGISGWFLTKKLNKQDEATFHSMMTNLFIETSTRGTDASGFSYMNQYGELITVKGGISSKILIEDKKWKKLANNIPQSCIMHCRARTKGSELDNFNNHPLVINKQISVIHNGCISNDDALREAYKLPSKGQVDSEVIPMMIKMYSDGLNELTKDKSLNMLRAINACSKQITGSYACATLNTETPNELFLFNHTNPICIGYLEKYGALLFASTDSILKASVLASDNREKYLDIFDGFKCWFSFVKDVPADMMMKIGLVNEKIKVTCFDLETKAFQTAQGTWNYQTRAWDCPEEKIINVADISKTLKKKDFNKPLAAATIYNDEISAHPTEDEVAVDRLTTAEEEV